MTIVRRFSLRSFVIANATLIAYETLPDGTRSPANRKFVMHDFEGLGVNPGIGVGERHGLREGDVANTLITRKMRFIARG